MSIKKLYILLGIGFLLLGAGYAVLIIKPGITPRITFGACERAGGEAWRVDIYHPDICPDCAAYWECQETYSDPNSCPEVTGCAACMEDNFPYPDHCPDGKESLGEISDAATWFLCCR